MFIRIKTINNSPYAYLVKNTWTEQGSRQKAAAYLGRVTKLGSVNTPFVPPIDGESNEEFLMRIIISLLEHCGFSNQEESTYVFGNIVVDATKQTVRKKAKPAVVEINEGFLCDMTIQNLMRFKDKKYSQDLQHRGLHPGKVLAQRILECGILIDPEGFILTFAHLVPNSDVLLKYM